MPTERIGDTVVKTYSEELRWQWGREVAFLRCMDNNYQVFPKLLKVGDHSITTAWAGETLARATDVDVERLRRGLSLIMTLLRFHKIIHRDITVHNVLWNPILRAPVLIDFGWSVWDWEDETPMPVPDVMKQTMHRHDWEQAAEVLRYMVENANDI